MKTYLLLIFFIYGLSYSQDFTQQITAPKHTKDRKYVFLSGGTYFQFGAHVNTKLTNTEGDIEQIVNTQILYYDLKLRLYKNFFLNYRQGISYNPVGYEEYDNLTGDLIVYEDKKMPFFRHSVSLQYYITIKKNTFNLACGFQQTGNLHTYIYYIKEGDWYYPVQHSSSGYSTDFVELG